MTAVVESLRLVTNWPWRFDRPRTWVRLPRSVDNAGRGKADSRAGVATKRENSLGFVLGWTPELSVCLNTFPCGDVAPARALQNG